MTWNWIWRWGRTDWDLLLRRVHFEASYLDGQFVLDSRSGDLWGWEHHTRLHIHHALENFEEGQTGEVQEGTQSQLLDLRLQSIRTASGYAPRTETGKWLDSTIKKKKKKELVTTINSIKDVTTYICILLRGARICNGNKTDVKTEYTHAGCGHESMWNPLVHSAAKGSDVSEGVWPCWKERILPDDL